jgi:hypothetical protein
VRGVCLALLLVACERHPDEDSRAERLATLERVRAHLVSIDPYAVYEVAYAYARLGETAKARAAPVSEDPIVVAYRARIEDAIAHRPLESTIPGGHVSAILDPFSRREARDPQIETLIHTDARDLDRAVALLEHGSIANRAVLHVNVIVAAAHHGRVDLARKHVEALGLALDTPEDAAWAIRTVARVARRIDISRELAVMIDRTARIPGAAQAARGGALGQLGKTDEAIALLAKTAYVDVRIRAPAYAHVAGGLPALEELAKQCRDLACVDAVVLGISGDD